MKNRIRLIGIIAMVLAIGFTVTSCNNGSDNNGYGNPKTVTYTGVSDGETYTLEITESTGRAAYQPKPGDSYKLTVGSKTSDGIVSDVVDVTFTLTPSNASNPSVTFTVTVSVSGNSLTAISGTITWSDDEIEVVDITFPSNSGGGDVPDLLPSGWQSFTYDDWEEFVDEASNLGNITQQQMEEFITFILDNYDSLSEGGKQFWKRVLPVDTHGIDISDWPQDDNNNSFGSGMYFRKSDDGLAIAINPMGRGDGTNYSPDIFILEENNGAAFPIGTWVNRENETLIFYSTTITFDTSYNYDLEQVNYENSNDVFTVSNYITVPYTPTTEDNAKLATYVEANFRSTHPWIPSTSSIDVKVKKGEWFYNIADDPTMEPFVSDDNIIGTWLVCDFISDPNTYNPSNPVQPDSNYWEGIQFESDGTVEYSLSNGWTVSGNWTTTTDTYVGSIITNVITGGIIKESNGEAAAPEFVIKKYNQDFYLFAQWKSGDYTRRAQKPKYYVFKKDN